MNYLWGNPIFVSFQIKNLENLYLRETIYETNYRNAVQ